MCWRRWSASPTAPSASFTSSPTTRKSVHPDHVEPAEALKNCDRAGHETHYPLEQAGNWVDCVRLKGPVIYNDFPRFAEPERASRRDTCPSGAS